MTIADNREDGGRLVREAWVRWARQQPAPKPHHLLPWEGLSDPLREADQMIWEEIVAPYVVAIDELHRRIARLEKDIDQLQEDLEECEGSWATSLEVG